MCTLICASVARFGFHYSSADESCDDVMSERVPKHKVGVYFLPILATTEATNGQLILINYDVSLGFN